MKRTLDESGFTLPELAISLVVLSVVILSFLGLFDSLVRSSILMKRKSVALTLATNQMEYLRGLPYNNLAVAGGSIVSSDPIPATADKVVDNVRYTVRTSINYLDDSFDGCGSYPSTQLKSIYCRNYSYANNATVDTNPADYKSVNVKVQGPNGQVLSEVDTQISARVAETSSSTGGIFIRVLDDNGNPLQGATVRVTNTTTTPQVDVSDSTDQNGNAIFYSLPPDTTNYDYVVTASMTGYSTLKTISPTGTLQPTYSNQKILTQQSSLLTMNLKPQGANSLVIETTGTTGTALANVKVYAKGGYKKYTNSTDTSYYYDNVSPSDTRPQTDANGLAVLQNLVPGDYYFCGDAGATSCVVGGTTYYLAAAVPYGGDNALSPINIPTYLASSPPTTTFDYNGTPYLQKVRLMLTAISNFPRIRTLAPDNASQATSTMSAFNFSITGTNLPCSSSPASCGTTVVLKQGATDFAASCTGTSAGTKVDCTVNLSAAVLGSTQLQVTANGNTLTIPSILNLGGITIGA